MHSLGGWNLYTNSRVRPVSLDSIATHVHEKASSRKLLVAMPIDLAQTYHSHSHPWTVDKDGPGQRLDWWAGVGRLMSYCCGHLIMNRNGVKL